jgi:hypothetical protein
MKGITFFNMPKDDTEQFIPFDKITSVEIKPYTAVQYQMEIYTPTHVHQFIFKSMEQAQAVYNDIIHSEESLCIDVTNYGDDND